MKNISSVGKSFIVIISLFLNPQILNAATVDVSTAAELQTALNDAETNGEDDIIQLAAGTYNTSDNGNAPFTFNSAENNSLTLTGAGASNSIIDGGGAGGTQGMNILITSTGSFSVSGIGFRNGDAAASGGGLGITSSGDDIEVRDCEFLDNTTAVGAGGLYIEASGTGTTTIDNNIFQGNNGDDQFGPGGTYVNSSNGMISFTNNQLSNNTANGDNTKAFASGGAFVQSLGAGVVFNDNFFENNQGAGGAFCPGGFYIQSYMTESSIQRNITNDNHTTSVNGFSPGGGYIQTFDAATTIAENQFNNNTGGTNSFSPGGAYIQTFDASATISDNQFNNNVSDMGDFSPGGAFLQTFGGPATITKNQFINNVGDMGDYSPGGGYLQLFDGGGTFDSNTFIENSGEGITDCPGGLALNAFDGNLIFTNNIFGSNTSMNSSGGAEVDLNGFDMNVVNNSFSLNESGGDGGGLRVISSDNATVINLYNNIVYDNTATGTGEDIFVENATFPGATINLFNNDFMEFCLEATATCDFTSLGANEADNLQSDPLLVDPENGNFQLSVDSPAIDAGDAAAPDLPATDHNGSPRTFGAAPDMGALEAVPTIAADPNPLDFGSTSSSRTSMDLTINNTGGVEANVTGLDLSDTTNFELDETGGANPCGSLPFSIPGMGSCTVTITFSPSSENTFDATLTISSDDPNNPDVVVNITGIKTSGGGCALIRGDQSPSQVGILWVLALVSGLIYLRWKKDIILTE